ncbi:MAG: hypothetical protein K6T75_01660 [Acetobacteraceae bacterium]|nr:hypothetical protein [Acetobacteraceae bacterium]
MNGLSPAETVRLIAHLGDMEEVDYRNTLALVALIELLAEKGLLTREEVALKAHSLEAELDRELALGGAARPPSSEPGALSGGHGPAMGGPRAAGRIQGPGTRDRPLPPAPGRPP